jgi:hypothetical protein
MPNPSEHRARRAAGRVARKLLDAQAQTAQAAGETEIAEVASTSPHLERGFILASSQHGPVPVYGVPLESVCAGMPIYIRRARGGGAPLYHYLGVASGGMRVSTAGTGAVTCAGGYGYGAASYNGPGAPGGSANLGTVPTSPATGYPTTYAQFPSGLPSTGMAWSFFYRLAGLPSATQHCIVLEHDLIDGSGNITGRIQFYVDYQGHFGIEVDGSAWGTSGSAITTHTFAPQRPWWVQVVQGLGLAVNGVQLTGDTLTSVVNSLVVPASNTHYAFNWLTGGDGIGTCPTGSWVSKFSFGFSGTGGSTAAWPTTVLVNPTPDQAQAGALVPRADSQIPQGDANFLTGMSIFNRYLINDATAPGAIPNYKLTDTGAYHGISSTTALTLVTPPNAVLQQGPYEPGYNPQVAGANLTQQSAPLTASTSVTTTPPFAPPLGVGQS